MKHKLLLTCLFSLVLASASVQASTLYWSGDGVTVGGPGTWNTTLARWSTASTAPFSTVWNNAQTDNANIDVSGGAGAGGSVVIGAAITMNGTLTLNVSGGTYPAYTINGTSTMTFGTASSISVPSGTYRNFNSPYAGTITKTGAGTVNFNNSNGNVTKFILSAGAANFSAGNRFGTGADRADFITFNGGSLRGDLSAWGSFGKSMTINATGGTIANSASTVAMTLDKTITWNGGNFALATGTFTLSGAGSTGSGTLTVSQGTTCGAAGVISSGVVLAMASGGTLTLNGNAQTVKTVSGTAGTVAVGTSTLTLNNPAGETYSSVFTGSGTGKIIKNGTGALTLSGSSTGFTGEFDLNAGAVTIGGVNCFGGSAGTGLLVINGGTISSTAARAMVIPMKIGGSFTCDQTAGSGAITFNSGAITIITANPTITVSPAAQTLTLGAVIGQDVAGRGFTKAGAGTLLVNNGANTYSGDTTITAGAISVDADGSLGTGAGILHLSGGALTISASRTATIPNPIDLTADSAITTTSTAAAVALDLTSSTIGGSAGTLTFRNDAASGTGVFQPRFSGGFTFGQPIAIVNGSFGTTLLQSFNTTGNDQTFNGLISGTGSYKRTASTGGTGGNTTFTAANTYSGGTTLGDGGIGFGLDSAGTPPSLTSGPIGTGALTVSPVVSGSPRIFASGAARNVGNAITLGGVLAVSGANDLTLSGVIGGTGGLTMSGAGTLTLSGINTYSGGTTVGAGTVDAPVAGSLGTSNVTVASGAILKLDAVGAISSSANLALNAGTPVVNLNFAGTSTIRTLSFDGGATLQPSGTWGTTASGATHADDVHFTGNGQLNVTFGSSATGLTTSGSPSTYGDTVTFTATVTGLGATPTGSVTFNDGVASIGTITLDGAGVAALPISSLSASVHSITAVYSGDSSNLGSSSSVVTQLVNKATLTVTGITASNKSYDGGIVATLSTGGAALVGIKGADDVTLVTASAAGAFLDKNVATGKTVQVSGLTLGGTTAGNYALTQPTTTADIAQASLNVSANGILVYGQDPTNAVYAPIYYPLLGSDTTNVLSGSATFSTDAITNSPVGSNYFAAVTSTGTLTAINYSFAAGTNGILTVTPAILTVTNAIANDKVYDGSTNATIVTSGAGLDGLVNGDEASVTLNSSGAAATFATKHVGNGKTVTFTGFATLGDLGTNYTVAQPTTTASIHQTNITVTAAPNARAYDGTTNAAAVPTVTVGGLQAGDTASFTEAYDTKHAGTGKTLIPAVVIADANSGANYNVTLVNDTAGEITAIALSVTGLSAQNKPYDNSTGATLSGAAGLSGVLGLDVVSLTGTASGAFLTKTVANGKTVDVSGLSLTGGDAGNYSLTPLVLTANITPLALTITGLSAQNKPYDNSTGATLSGTAGLSGVLGLDVVSLTGTASGAFLTKTVANGKAVDVSGLTLTGADAGNYSLAPLVLTANITPLALTITGLSAQNKPYDNSTAATLSGTAGLSGVLGLDVVSLTGTASGAFLTKTVANGKTVDVSGLSLAGADAGNYSLTPLALTADITPLALTITGLSAQNKPYDNSTAATLSGTAGLSGVLGLDVVSLTGTASGAFLTKTVANGKTVDVTGLSLTGADAGNYSLTPLALTADITPLALTITGLSAQNKPYDNSTAATLSGTAGLSGVLGLDVVSLTGTASGAFLTKTVANGKTVDVSGLSLTGADAGNYSLTPLALTADITPLALTITGLSAQNKPYDDSTAATLSGTAGLSGVLGLDVVSLTGTASGAFLTKTVANGKTVDVTGLSLTGADAGNYSLTPLVLTANITPLALTITGLSAQNKPYDNSTAATLSGTAGLSGVLGLDVVSLTGAASGAFLTKTVANGKTVDVIGLSLTGADAGNYSLTPLALTADITPLALTITGLSAQNKPYDDSTAATLSGTAGLSGVLGLDVVSLTGTASGAFLTKTVANGKTVDVTGLSLTGADAGNYSLTPLALTADITPLALTITGLSAQNKPYDASTAATLSGTAGLSGVLGLDVVSLTGTASGAFTDANVAIGKTVNVTGLSLTGADAGNYSLTPLSLSADITGASSTTALISSLNPSTNADSVTFTVTVSSGVGTPTGDVVFKTNGVTLATVALVGGSASTATASLPVGTNMVTADYAAQANWLGSSGSLDQVVKSAVTYSETNSILSIVNNGDGSYTLNCQGTPGARYYVVASTDVSAAMSSWTPVGTTNTAPSPSGQWSATVSGSAPLFYRAAAVDPAP